MVGSYQSLARSAALSLACDPQSSEDEQELSPVTATVREVHRRTGEKPDEAQRRINDLRAEARYRRQRRDLYRARVYSSRPTTLARMRELERLCAVAEERLRHAERQQARPA